MTLPATCARAHGPSFRARPPLAVRLATVLCLYLLAVTAHSAQNPADPMLARAAHIIGVRQCYGALHDIAARVVPPAATQDVLLDWDHARADAAAVFSLTGFELHGARVALSLTTVPQPGGTCGVLAEQISSSPLECARIAREELAGYRPAPLIRGIDVYTAPAHPHETVTLVSTEGTCLVIRRQVEYGWPAS